MDLGLRDCVALVTGASRGLGRATVEALVGEGVRVVAVARNSQELKALAAMHREQVFALPLDLLESGTPRVAVETAVREFGRLDIAIVNTPGPPPMEPLKAEEGDFAAAFDAVFYPAVRLIQCAIGPMTEAARGRIVIVSSTSVKAPKSFLSLSATSRSALWAWAKSAAPELGKRGITINSVFAGPHRTARATQLGARSEGIGEPQDFGEIVTAMCGRATGFITGTGYVLDGGELRGLL